MLEITRDEAEYLRNKNIYVTKSCRFKNNGTKRGKFYCEESNKAFKELGNYRKSIMVTEEYPVSK